MNSVRVIFTPSAERQIESLHAYISAQSGQDRADRYVGRIVTFCQGLGSFQLRGTKRDDLLEGLRTIEFERRVTIAFFVSEAAVLIEGIFYGGQDFEAAFEN